MEIFGRKVLDYNTRIPLDGIDEVVFRIDNQREIVVSIYRAKEDCTEVEVRTTEGGISVIPQAANVIKIRPIKFV